MRKFAEASLDVLTFSRDGEAPIHRQVYSAIRGYILDRRLPSGAKLPATRDLAKQLGVGRNTIVAAYDQLLAEGYLEARAGSCTRVAQLPAARGSSSSARTGVPSCGLSRRGKQIADLPQPHRSRGVINLYPGVPETATFPFSVWAKLLARSARKNDDDIVGIHDYAGHPRLRTAIAQYLGTARGVACEAEQVIVVTGAQAALDLVSRILVDDGDWAWMEEPGYRGASTALLGGGARLAPLRVSRPAGASTTPRPAKTARDLRDAVVPMALRHGHADGGEAAPAGARRAAQLPGSSRTTTTANTVSAASPCRRCAASMAPTASFTSAPSARRCFSSLRLGFLVVPRATGADAFGAALSVSGQFAPPLLQATVADFIREGHFASHLKRMRRLYAGRQDSVRRPLPATPRRLADGRGERFRHAGAGASLRPASTIATSRRRPCATASTCSRCRSITIVTNRNMASCSVTPRWISREAERGDQRLARSFLDSSAGARACKWTRRIRQSGPVRRGPDTLVARPPHSKGEPILVHRRRRRNRRDREGHSLGRAVPLRRRRRMRPVRSALRRISRREAFRAGRERQQRAGRGDDRAWGSDPATR